MRQKPRAPRLAGPLPEGKARRTRRRVGSCWCVFEEAEGRGDELVMVVVVVVVESG